MSEDDKNGEAPPQRKPMPLPAVAAIAFYLLLMAVAVVLGVVAWHVYPAFFLVLPVALIAAAAGLLLMLRWAWAMALSAVFLLAAYNLWIFSSFHQGAALVQGLLNLVFFLYLVRPEVREKLR
jgi:glycerol-3-phosphate acyltransferase PlsY